jgi:tRNA (guanine37-N1)-methyltransferase
MSRPPNPPPESDRIAVGIIRKPHGVRGDASVEPWTADVSRFEDLTRVTLVAPEDRELRPAIIDGIRVHGSRLLLHFEGVDSPEEAGELRNWTIEIPASEARALEPDEYYLHDLVGLELIDVNGVSRGVVTVADEAGSGVLLTVRRADGHTYDVPFASSICTEIDLPNKRMRVDLPEGIEDLDAIPVGDSAKSGALGERASSPQSSGVSPDDQTQPVSAGPLESGVILSRRSAAKDPEVESTEGRGDTPLPNPGFNSGVLRRASPAQDDTQARAGLKPQLRVDIVTIFPKMVEPLVGEGVIARAIKSGILDIHVWDLRDYATDKHRSTDDEAYGGGPGMVMMAEPLFRCVDAIQAKNPEARPHVVLTSPQGRVFDHAVAQEHAARPWLVILCGRYEGVDERVREAIVDEELSIGDFVLSGGELAAMVVVDAVGRLIDGVVGNAGSVEGDSFFNGLLDYPHYTRPEEIRGVRIPDILLSGHHEKIRKWRKEQSLRATLRKRPDLLERAELDAEAKAILQNIENESGG